MPAFSIMVWPNGFRNRLMVGGSRAVCRLVHPSPRARDIADRLLSFGDSTSIFAILRDVYEVLLGTAGSVTAGGIP